MAVSAASAAHARRWGYDRLRGGVQEPFFAAALLERSIQPAMGAMFRSRAVAWSDFPIEAGGAWDLWLAYLACREGGAAFYVADALLRYRIHPGALTARQDVGWNRGKVFIYDRLVRDARLVCWKRTFRGRLAAYHLAAGMALLRRKARRDARSHFRAGLRTASLPKASIGLALSYLPDGPLQSVFALYGGLRA